MSTKKAGRTRAARWTASVIAALSLVATLIVGTPPGAASAYTGADFDPGYIISDSQFYASTSMSASDIQAFLNGKVTSCRSGYTCLKDFTAPAPYKPGDPMCTAYPGNGGAQTAATIIANVAVACGISPKVLLVMLQKEQSLVTDTWPSAGQYRSAMGAGCPDTAGCDPAQAGFFNQVYYAAWFLKRYAGPPGTGSGTPYTSTFNAYSKFSNYAPGANFEVRLHPNPDCGTKTVYIRNQPTASLYTYTPYTPNQAALNNLGTYGDACSSYGNRNFWDYYYRWFGSPTVVTPKVPVARVDGIDRYVTAAKIAQRHPATTGGVVYIASGANFPDGISAAPAATQQNAPLLLVEPGGIPEPIKTELVRLAPSLIVVVGGEESVSASTYSALAAYSTSIRRDGGTDRYATSRMVADAAFESTATAYLASGLGFADALTASPAAAMADAPVILVDGQASTVDAATLQLLRDLDITVVAIAGGPLAMSTGIETSLRSEGFTVVRRGGADRYAVAHSVNRNAFTSSSTVYVASGTNFPDALAGAALAGATNSALYLSPGNCLFRRTAQDIIELGATNVVLLGGTSVLNNGVSSYVNCD